MLNIALVLKTMSPQRFAEYGIDGLAYVRALTQDDGTTIFAVHAADGSLLSHFEDRGVARIAAAEHELNLVSVH